MKHGKMETVSVRTMEEAWYGSDKLEPGGKVREEWTLRARWHCVRRKWPCLGRERRGCKVPSLHCASLQTKPRERETRNVGIQRGPIEDAMVGAGWYYDANSGSNMVGHRHGWQLFWAEYGHWLINKMHRIQWSNLSLPKLTETTQQWVGNPFVKCLCNTKHNEENKSYFQFRIHDAYKKFT